MASIGKFVVAGAAATQESTLALTNINFDFSLVKMEAPLEFRGLGSALSSKRKRDAEEGLLSTSSTHDDDSATIKLTPRAWEMIIVAYRSLKDGCNLGLDYEKLADLAGSKVPASAKAVWGRVK